MTKGYEAMMVRGENAEARFIATCVENCGVDEATAAKAMAVFLKTKLIKIDYVGGQMIVKNGAVYETENLVFAASNA